MDAILRGELIVINDPKAVALHEKSHYGKFNQDELQLSPMEALYLQEKGKIKITDNTKNGKLLSLDEMWELIQEKAFYINTLSSETYATVDILLKPVSSMVLSFDCMKGANPLVMVIPTLWLKW